MTKSNQFIKFKKMSNTNQFNEFERRPDEDSDNPEREIPREGR
jgi:hypothetical protein